jgi:hypothetical protein
VEDITPSKQIDYIIKNTPGWRGETLSKLRLIIRLADSRITEEVKWKKPSRPEGVPVWVLNGNVCIADTLKNAVRLTFPKGAQISDPNRIFNTRLDSKTVRAVDFFESSDLDEAALIDIVSKAAAQNDV